MSFVRLLTNVVSYNVYFALVDCQEAVLAALQFTDPRGIFDSLDADADGFLSEADLAVLVEGVRATDPAAAGTLWPSVPPETVRETQGSVGFSLYCTDDRAIRVCIFPQA